MNEYKSKNNNTFRNLVIIFSIILVICILMFIISLFNYVKIPSTYDDVVYQEVTFEYYREIDDSEGYDSSFNIFVTELDKPLHINNIVLNKIIRLKIYDFKPGDKFYCYYTENDYEVVEFGTNMSFMTLTEYKDSMSDNYVGLIVISLGLVVCSATMILIVFIINKRDKKIKNN